MLQGGDGLVYVRWRVLRIGRYLLASIVDATFALDGGAVFGVVPRPVWERRFPPDASNRIRLATRCLLASDPDARRHVLVDAGMGTTWAPADAARYAAERAPGGLEAALAAAGLTVGDVTDVILSHLHLDHAGGVVRRGADGALALTFPRAVHHVQRSNWAWAHGENEKDSGKYLAASFAALEHSGRLHLVDGERELYPDLQLVVSEGHTAGQQLARFHGDGTHLTCCADLIPTRAHVRIPWVMAYDLYPLTTIEEKKVLLAEVLEEEGMLFFGHDPEVAACRLGEVDGRPAVREPVQV